MSSVMLLVHFWGVSGFLAVSGYLVQQLLVCIMFFNELLKYSRVELCCRVPIHFVYCTCVRVCYQLQPLWTNIVSLNSYLSLDGFLSFSDFQFIHFVINLSSSFKDIYIKLKDARACGSPSDLHLHYRRKISWSSLRWSCFPLGAAICSRFRFMRPFACVNSLNPVNLRAPAAGSGFRLSSSRTSSLRAFLFPG